MTSTKGKIIAIVGPTASGKTSLSIDIAKKYNGAVISADSRQVYKGLDLGTGKVTETEKQNIKHYLLDVSEPGDTYTAHDFDKDANLAIEACLKEKCLPIIAGGTFFYLDILRKKQTTSPVSPDPTLRAKLEELSNKELYQIIQTKDKNRSQTIDPDNRRRLIRSLEIIEIIGEVPLEKPEKSPYDWLIIGIDIDKKKLHHNIHVRLESRLGAGMVKEVQILLDAGITYDRMQELGLEYKYVSKYLFGEIDYNQMKEQLEIKIRQFAKRQMTWLKRDVEIEWFAPENREAIFRQVDDFLNPTT